ncbi:MAG TPA: exodeoxyribonuclease I [Wenzhouxiangella sp.]
MSNETFLWHDYETFGANPRSDRPCQFAALRTDDKLEPIESPTIIYCQPGSDTLPHPGACLVTGITPQTALAKGEAEPRFAQQIMDIMSRPGTCVVGYNNFRFDDEVTRHLFWRNFLDPYAREYANGNSRFDLINVLRLTRALRPEGIQWADYEDGQPSFRLEDIAKANGLDTDCAHDALVDVENTLGLAQMLLKQQPKLWAWALQLRDKTHVDGLLAQGEPLLMASSFFAKRPGSVSAVLPFGRHPKFNNQWLAWDLAEDPALALKGSMDDWKAQLAGTQAPDNTTHDRLPVTTIKINQCPMIAPLSVADSATQIRLGLDLNQIRHHQNTFANNPDWARQLSQVFAERPTFAEADIDPEANLYGGFVPRQDQNLVRQIAKMDGPALAAVDEAFSDARLNTLLFRYRARHYPASLSADERARWLADRKQRLITGVPGGGLTLTEFLSEVDQLAANHPDRQALVDALRAWPDEIDAHALA